MKAPVQLYAFMADLSLLCPLSLALSLSTFTVRHRAEENGASGRHFLKFTMSAGLPVERPAPQTVLIASGSH